MKPLLVFVWLLNSNFAPAFAIKTNAHTDDFKTLVLQSDIFVDKSMLILEFLNMDPKTYIPVILRPRGWGKTTNMDMIRRFFEIEVDDKGKRLPQKQTTNDKLFLGGEIQMGKNSPPKKLNPLKISHVQKVTRYMGTMPVIVVKFENVTGKSYEEIERNIIFRIVQTFQNHRYLSNYTGVVRGLQKSVNFAQCLAGNFNQTSLKISLYALSNILQDYHRRKVIILVDDYDAPLINAYLEFGRNTKEYTKVVVLLHHLYQKTLKNNPFAFKVLMTGVLKLNLDIVDGKDKIPKSFVLESCTSLYPCLSYFFGFARQEVEDLLKKLPISIDVDQMNSWYGGYSINKHTYFNSDLVMKSIMNNGSMDFYEQSITGEALLDKILTTDRMQPKIQTLISGQKIEFNSYWLSAKLNWESLQEFVILYHSGFLNRTNSIESTELAIPNKQIQHVYEMKTLKWVATQFGSSSTEFISFAHCLSNGSMEQFRETLNKYLSNAAPLIEGGEKKAIAVYKALIIALQNALSYSHEKITSDLSEGFSLVPKSGRSDTAIVFKYKIAKKKRDMGFGAKSCVEKINKQLNGSGLKTCSQIRRINKIGVAVCGIQATVENQIKNISNYNDTLSI